MKCNICDASLNEPKYVPGLKGNFDPCDKCMAIIEDTLAGFLDTPAAAEDDLGGPDLFEEVYPTSYDPFGD